MAVSKQQKVEIVKELKEKIDNQKSIVFVDFTGIKVKDLSSLRKKLKDSGNELKVVKKSLTDIALKDSQIEAGIKELSGEVALIFGYNDEIVPAKEAFDFSKSNKGLKILGGILEGKFIEADKVVELAKLPSREQLLGQLVGTIAAPMSGFVNVLQGNIRGLVQVLSQIQKTKN